MLSDYDAIAYIRGGEKYSDISGTVGFKGVSDGTWVDVNVEGLPPYSAASEGVPQTGPHGFHIHNGSCGGENFAEAGDHFGTGFAPHGNHRGDLPALFSNNGRAKMLVFTDKFMPADVVGKSVIIHASPDDYTTQPSGGSGEKIACGLIEEYLL